MNKFETVSAASRPSLILWVVAVLLSSTPVCRGEPKAEEGVAGRLIEQRNSSGQTEIKIYPAPTGKGSLPASDAFSVTVNGKAVKLANHL